MGQHPRRLDPQASPQAFFGAAVRSWRSRRGLSLARLGHQVYVSGDLLGKIEKAQRRASPELIALLDVALGADGELLRAGVGLTEPGEGISENLLGWYVEPGQEDSEALSPVLSGLREVMSGCRRLDHALGARAVLVTITTQVGVAEAFLPGCPPWQRGDLLAILAQLHQFAGWLAFDQGQIPTAARAFTTVTTHAQAACRADLTAFVLGPSHGFALTSSGNPQDGARLGRAALEHALRVGNPRLTAFVRATTARAHARLGEAGAALKLLEQAEEDLDRIDGTEVVPDWLSVFDVAALRGHRGSCLLDLARPGSAIEELISQDNAAPRCFARNRTIWLLDRARAHLDHHDLPATCQVLDRALSEARTTSSRRIRARLLASAGALAPHRSHPAVAATLDRLRCPQVI